MYIRVIHQEEVTYKILTMKAGYEIKHNASDDALGDDDTDIVLINNFNGTNTVLVNYASSDDTGKHIHATPDSETVAIFRIRRKSQYKSLK